MCRRARTCRIAEPYGLGCEFLMVDGPDRHLKVEEGMAMEAAPLPVLVLGHVADDVVGMELGWGIPLAVARAVTWRNCAMASLPVAT